MFTQFQHFSNSEQSGNAVESRTWNGSQWVPAPSGMNQAPAQHYSSAPRQSSHHNSVTAPETLLQKYTRFYHGWLAQEKDHRAYAERLPSGAPAHGQAIQHATTCRSYAEASSRAAHYFHSNPSSNSAPFSLPPEPPETTSTAPQTNTQTKPSQQPAVSSTPARTPSQNYIERCFNQCFTPNEKALMTKEVERLMTGLMKDGSFQSMDWDNLELIPVPGQTQSRAQSSAKNQGTESQSYYGPSTTSAPLHTSDSGASYYGPSTPGAGEQHKKYKKRGFSSISPSGTSSYAHLSLSSQKKKQLAKQGFNIDTAAMSDRARRFTMSGGASNIGEYSTQSCQFDRFMGKATIGGSNTVLTEDDFEKMTVKGTCLVLEKEYLRLTEPPKATKVRPEPILRQHLANLKAKKAKRDYVWFCSQYKAIRQDCTVQRIQNEFAVDVYETHARVALMEEDVNEFNQCQTQLIYLYDLLSNNQEAVKNKDEFAAYRVLYYVLLMGNPKFQGGSSEVLSILSQLSNKRDVLCIKHALQVREAWTHTDYHSFFKLRKMCPNKGGYLMEQMVPTMRFKGLQRICQAYRPLVDVSFVTKELGIQDQKFAVEWLKSCGCIISQDQKSIQTKESTLRESDLEQKTSLI